MLQEKPGLRECFTDAFREPAPSVSLCLCGSILNHRGTETQRGAMPNARYDGNMSIVAEQIDDLSRPPWLWPRSAYVHIPFCAHHCGYCDFAIAVNQDGLIESYLQALALEVARLEKPQPMQTLFLGGGTPTLSLCQGSGGPAGNAAAAGCRSSTAAEFSDRSQSRHARCGQDCGAGRTWRQSPEPRAPSPSIAACCRHWIEITAPRTWPRSWNAFAGTFRSVSLDLIFGVPGQTLASGKKTSAGHWPWHPTTWPRTA